MDHDRTLSSYNLPFLESLYEQYQADPSSVDPQWRDLMARADRGEQWPSNGHARARPVAAPPATAPVATGGDAEQIILQNHVDKLIHNYRLMGHIEADLDPLERPRKAQTPALTLEFNGLSEAHLDREFNPGSLFPERDLVPLREIVGRLQRTYCRHVGVEYWHINRVEHRDWLREQMEPVENEVVPDRDEQVALLKALAYAEKQAGRARAAA